jgi:hypothetical protein
MSSTVGGSTVHLDRRKYSGNCLNNFNKLLKIWKLRFWTFMKKTTANRASLCQIFFIEHYISYDSTVCFDLEAPDTGKCAAKYFNFA